MEKKKIQRKEEVSKKRARKASTESARKKERKEGDGERGALIRAYKTKCQNCVPLFVILSSQHVCHTHTTNTQTHTSTPCFGTLWINLIAVWRDQSACLWLMAAHHKHVYMHFCGRMYFYACVCVRTRACVCISLQIFLWEKKLLSSHAVSSGFVSDCLYVCKCVCVSYFGRFLKSLIGWLLCACVFVCVFYTSQSYC